MNTAFNYKPRLSVNYSPSSVINKSTEQTTTYTNIAKQNASNLVKPIVSQTSSFTGRLIESPKPQQQPKPSQFKQYKLKPGIQSLKLILNLDDVVYKNKNPIGLPITSKDTLIIPTNILSEHSDYDKYILILIQDQTNLSNIGYIRKENLTKDANGFYIIKQNTTLRLLYFLSDPNKYSTIFGNVFKGITINANTPVNIIFNNYLVRNKYLLVQKAPFSMGDKDTFGYIDVSNIEETNNNETLIYVNKYLKYKSKYLEYSSFINN